ncbi:MAG: hypothetical protein LUC93_01850 [Planctomycetaceae bacterium]|nr:hypothetical protein [Planctomycetaceae bacterium]
MNTDLHPSDADAIAIASALRTRMRRKTILAGILLFLGGLIVGGGAMSYYLLRTLHAASPTPEHIGELLVRDISHDVSVSADELSAIRSQVDRHIGAMALSNREYGEGVRRQFGELCSSICGILGRDRALHWKDSMRRRYGERAGEYIHMNDCHFDTEEDCLDRDTEVASH